MATKTPIRDVIEKGVKELLKEAQVPQHVHLRVVQKLREALDDHKADTAEYKDIYKQHKEDMAAHEERDRQHEEQIIAYTEELVRAKAHDWTGPEGKPGKNAQEVDIPALIQQIIALIPPSKDGIDGRNGKDGKDGETPDEEKLVEKLITRVQKGDVIHINHVRGAAAFIKDGVKYRTEELMHGGGVKEYVPTGTIDGVNLTFTLPFASSNWKVYADGARQRATKDYTIAGTTLTFTFAPTTTVICDN